MTSTRISRRALAASIGAIAAGLGLAAPMIGPSSSAETPAPAQGDGLTHASESIRQEVRFEASRRRVYEALTNAAHFDAITRLSDAVALVTAANAKPTSISRVTGGSFTLFGGLITGRNLELLRGERLVQAWRTASWSPGDFSIVRFSLTTDGAGTKLTFDHRGFPLGLGAHLADGWHVHYWAPMAIFLGQR